MNGTTGFWVGIAAALAFLAASGAARASAPPLPAPTTALALRMRPAAPAYCDGGATLAAIVSAAATAP